MLVESTAGWIDVWVSLGPRFIAGILIILGSEISNRIVNIWCENLSSCKWQEDGLRVCSYERPNELKSLWDFILVENLALVFSQPFTCVHINWGKMNRFHISHFHQNEISNRLEIFLGTKLTRNKINKHRLVGYLMHIHIWNSLRIWISYWSFWQKWSFILGDEMKWKWNLMWADLVFMPVWNLKPVWAHFLSSECTLRASK